MSSRNCVTLAWITTQSEDLQAPRQKHHLCRRWTFPLRKVLFEANFFGKGASGHRDTLLQNIMKCDIRKVARRCRVVR